MIGGEGGLDGPGAGGEDRGGGDCDVGRGAAVGGGSGGCVLVEDAKIVIGHPG